MLRIFLILISFILFFEVDGQNNDSTTKAGKGFFGKWGVAGISWSGGVLSPKNVLDISFFKSVLTSNTAKDKYNFDVLEIDKYEGKLTSRVYNEIFFTSLKLVFKPKKIEFSKLLSYVELSTGITYSNHKAWLSVYGFENIDSNYKEFSTSYNFEHKNVALDGLVTIQSPGFFRFSVYSGIGVLGGMNIDSWVISDASKQEVGIINNDYRDDTVTYPFGKENGYSKSDWMLGWYIPIGLKVNLSAKSNLFIEYIISNRTLFFQNKFRYTSRNTGFIIGFRYKFISNQGREKLRNQLTTTPEPFY